MAIWLLVFGTGTVLVRAGLAVLACGSVRDRDVGQTALRSAADVAAATLAFWAVGASLLLGPRGGFVSFDHTLVLAGPVDSADGAATEFYHWAVALVGGAVVSAAVAGRGRFAVGVVASAVLAGVVYPVVGHLVWFGWLRTQNVIDFGGALAVHLPAAVFALVGAVAVGARGDRDEGTPAVSAVAVGVALTAVGWLPYLVGGGVAHPTDFNPGEPLELAVTALNTAVAAATGLAGGLAYGRWRLGRADVWCAASGLLGGLVAVTAACDAVGSREAAAIGLVAGFAVPAAARLLRRRIGLDDPAGLVAVHGVGAIWGVLAAALFASGTRPRDHLQLAFVQVLAVAVVVVLSTAAAAVTFGLLRLTGPFRPAVADPRP